MSKLHATRIIFWFRKTINITHLLILENEVSFHLYKSGYFNTRSIIKVLLEYVAANFNIVTLGFLSKSLLSPGSASLNIKIFSDSNILVQLNELTLHVSGRSYRSLSCAFLCSRVTVTFRNFQFNKSTYELN